jgi:hypothetical protein
LKQRELLCIANVVLALSACSTDVGPSAPASGADAGGGASSTGGSAPVVVVSNGGASPVHDASSAGGSASTGGVGPILGPLTPIFRGIVVDASTAAGFDPSRYSPLVDVEVCVYEDSTLPCAISTRSGEYEFDGAPQNRPFHFSYKKAGFDPVLYPVGATAPGSYGAPFIAMASVSFNDSFMKQVGVERDPTKGTIQFAAAEPGTQTDAGFFQVFGGMGFVYLKDFQVSVSPNASEGPFYVSEAWRPDGNLTRSSAAGWGFVTASPGDYTLTFAHPTHTCGTITTTVVAGYSTVYVGAICSPLGDAGTVRPNRDAGASLDAAVIDGAADGS